MSSFVYDIRLNHVGFPCLAKKVFVFVGEGAEEYEIKRMSNGELETVFQGKLLPSSDNDTVLGNSARLGDFSALSREGVYKIFVGDKASRTFFIYDKAYDAVCRTISGYFEWQRCADDCGYNPNCHAGDKITDKDGVTHSLAGGHHQSGDLRKWAFGCPAGIYGLSEYLINHKPLWSKGRLEYDIRHSAKHYIARISPEGYVYDCTFVPEYYNDAECHGKGYPSETAFWDDFLYFDTPTDPHGHANVIRMLASASVSLKGYDDDYADKCLAGAQKVYEWLYNIGQNRTSHKWLINPPLGHDNFKELYFDFYFKDSALMLADVAFSEIELYRLTKENNYKARAIKRLKSLLELQVRKKDGSHKYFRLSKDSDRYAEEVKFFPVNIPLVFTKALDAFGISTETEFILDVLDSFVKFYQASSESNVFGKTTTKCSVTDGEVVWDQEAGSYVQDLADTALFLTLASKYVSRDICLGIAQRLIDFIIGANHADVSCIEGVGYNQLPYAVFGEFFPPIPKIPGAVITEIYHTNPQDDLYGREYDMPIVGATLLALAEYQREISK